MPAPDKPSGVVQGTLDMLILETLALEPMHGYGIGARLEQISQGILQVNAGSLFPAFRRLERDGLIKGGLAGDREQPPRQVTTRSPPMDARSSNTKREIGSSRRRRLREC